MGVGVDSDGTLAVERGARTCGSNSPFSSRSSALLVTRVRSGVYHPGRFSPAVEQKIHHAVRIEAAGINPESDVRQAVPEFYYDHGVSRIRPPGSTPSHQVT